MGMIEEGAHGGVGPELGGFDGGETHGQRGSDFLPAQPGEAKLDDLALAFGQPGQNVVKLAGGLVGKGDLLRRRGWVDQGDGFRVRLSVTTGLVE